MKLDELNWTESALIEIIRNFSFLCNENYYESEISIRNRDYMVLIYTNHIINQKIIIRNVETLWDISIKRKKLFALKSGSSIFNISDYYQHFDIGMMKGYNYSLNSHVKYLKENLMPVVKGEMWIDELIKKQKK